MRKLIPLGIDPSRLASKIAADPSVAGGLATIGMDPGSCPVQNRGYGRPRAGGDGPQSGNTIYNQGTQTPRRRGWTPMLTADEGIVNGRPRAGGRQTYKRTFFPVHIQAPREQPQAPRQDPEAPNPKAATETHRPQTSKGGRSQSPTAETPSRANPGRGRSQPAEVDRLLPVEKPNPRAQGARPALCPGKKA